MQKSEHLGISFKSLFKRSHRSQKEQIVGLLVFPFAHFFFLVVNHSMIDTPSFLDGRLPLPLNESGWILAYSLSALGFWSLWRRHSLLVLKLELSLFLSNLVFSFPWFLLFFTFSESFLAMVDLLLLICTLSLSVMVFWKKELVSALLFVPYLLWVLYLGSLNMLLCLST